MEASLLIKHRHTLAESPLWHSQRNSLFWVDIENKTLHEYSFDTITTTTIDLPGRPGFVVQDNQNNLVIGLQRGIASYDLDKGQLSWLKDVEREVPKNRCNDGKCDSKARLWFGTMDVDCKAEAGSLYLLDSDLHLNKKAEGLTIPNGLAWSLDNKQLYHIDSTRRSVVRYRYNEKSGEIAGAETIIRIPDNLGLPDGMTIDEEGMLWIAHYGGFGVYRWNPNNGACIEKVKLPVPNVTSCAFGGRDLDMLCITTASDQMDEETFKKFPLSGSIFMVRLGIKGIKANIFKK